MPREQKVHLQGHYCSPTAQWSPKSDDPAKVTCKWCLDHIEHERHMREARAKRQTEPEN